MTSARAKGLAWCREVKGILENAGHKVEGPMYGASWIPKLGQRLVHKDFFGCLDLISYAGGTFYGHQITSASNKADRAGKLKDAGIKAWLWIRKRDKKGVVWWIYDETIGPDPVKVALRDVN